MLNTSMLKYAISEDLIDNKSGNTYLKPWINAGAKTFQKVSEVPDNYILISYHVPPWRQPYKDWITSGNKHIEIDYGYWGVNNPRRNTRRVTYMGSHNINMKPVPYSRVHTLNPAIQPWKKINEEGYILIIEPQPKILLERTGEKLGDWSNKIKDILDPHWNGNIKFRRKAGGKNPGRWSSFIEDLKGCRAVIGERTMACVEAVMLGYPAYTIDNSAVSLLMGNDISFINKVHQPDREQFLEHIAWSQFYPEEFSNGRFVVDCVEQYQIFN